MYTTQYYESPSWACSKPILEMTAISIPEKLQGTTRMHVYEVLLVRWTIANICWIVAPCSAGPYVLLRAPWLVYSRVLSGLCEVWTDLYLVPHRSD